MNNNNKFRSFLTNRGLLDLLLEFEDYCASPALPSQSETSVMEVDQKKEPKKAGFRHPFIGEVKKFKASSSTSKIGPLPETVSPATPPVTPLVKVTYYSIPQRTVGKSNSQDAPASQNVKASKPANSSQTIRDLKVQPAANPDFRNLSALLAILQVAYHIYSLKEEREFRVVLRGVPKELPIEETALRRAPARAVTDNLSYAKATAGSRKDPPSNSAPITSSSEDIKALMSMISIIDIGKIVLLANKFKAAVNPVENTLILAEHSSLVEAIKNNKIEPVQNIISLIIPYQVETKNRDDRYGKAANRCSKRMWRSYVVGREEHPPLYPIKIGSDISQQELKLPNLFAYRHDKISAQEPAYRGTAVLIRCDVMHEAEQLMSFETMRSIGTRAGSSDHEVRLLATYRPPGTRLCVQDIHSIFDGPTPTLIIGDLNAKHKAWGSHSISRIGRQLMEDAELQEYEVLGLNTPTHVSTDPRHRPDVLDIVLSHKIRRPMHVEVVYGINMQHLPIHVTVGTNTSSSPHRGNLCRQLTKATAPKCPITHRSGIRLYDVKAQAEIIAGYLAEQFNPNPPATSAPPPTRVLRAGGKTCAEIHGHSAPTPSRGGGVECPT
ncbi:Probable RNA-directed DNA polymerase from transposon BS [Eumeta japonica]|uniref:Probable RNA-directed DNA polymerase from transposon BS n=1 Tax=Eumeta variegata TaxID=151549 RepID=A0A4C1WV08_EUMVA|nr:Probable RNA-directed DNA polymerase from transposon BS [Eumeta japonica]